MSKGSQNLKVLKIDPWGERGENKMGDIMDASQVKVLVVTITSDFKPSKQCVTSANRAGV